MSEIHNFVSRTSRFMAGIRAIETARPDRLFADPFAAELAGAEVLALLEPWKKEYLEKNHSIVTVRTRFFDDFLRSSISQSRQVVLLGSGLDTRAFRLPWPSETHFYEIDRPEVLALKDSILQKTPAQCQRHEIAADLSQSWSHLLLDGGYQVNRPSVWILEGLLYYLNQAEAKQLLKTISDLSTTGSCLGADLVNVKMLQKPTELVKHWRFGCDEPEKLFAAFGWKASVVQPGEKGADFGRYRCQPPRDVPGVSRNFFVTARKESH
ncbi:MAG: SAM-dependent methyltransferase [Moorea sp. SIO4E2]|uniref:SAM-dependent methyltransferase n=1 Tax=Moorena sp. SIO4E2 TaxID=2607826 RepID=UPI0013B7FAD8|nr:SAM-dependent methyltransferase [Moorena sp. SIO4E2]NEQ11980.1 SAM-dependent methyltransferase [Moorena sp. SIO4E2]